MNNAGISGPNMPTWEYGIEDWRRVIDVDLTGPFLVSRAVVPEMRRAGYGRIVNIASVAGKEGNPNASAYSAAKAGLIALTKSLGKELAGSGVIVNCVTPAAVETRIFAQMSQSHIDFMLSKIPLARFGLPQEIAAMVAWLCFRRLFVLDRRRVRYFRRASHLLTERRARLRGPVGHISVVAACRSLDTRRACGADVHSSFFTKRPEITMPVLRSLLFVPGNRANMLQKATGSNPDAFIPDLEDSVPALTKKHRRAT